MTRCPDLPIAPAASPAAGQTTARIRGYHDLKNPESIVTQRLIPPCFRGEITIEELIFALPEVCHRCPFEPMALAFIAK